MGRVVVAVPGRDIPVDHASLPLAASFMAVGTAAASPAKRDVTRRKKMLRSLTACELPQLQGCS